MNVRLMVTVSGKVQGVGFRHSARENALRLGVAGWVKNLYNGEVQLCIEGEKNAVRALVEWCHEGPKLAKVGKVLIEASVFREEFTDFSIAG